MYIYLPIAELPVSILLLLGLGSLGGILAGMFGIGGGFLLTPLLIFIGVPPSIAVATSANQIIASSFSGFLAQWRKNNVDIKMGLMLLIGGLIGSTLGVAIFKILQETGQIDLAISLIYVIFLGTIGTLMAIESTKMALKKRRGEEIPLKPKKHWIRELPLPFKMQFPRSNLEISLLLPIVIGIFAGMLVSLMGIGGGFIMIPAMIYLLGMPTNVVIGTSLFQIIFTSANVTLLHAIKTQSVDVVLALLLIVGGVIGAQIGTNLGGKMAPEKLRMLLAAIVLAVCLRLFIGLVVEPSSLFTIEVLNG